MVSAFKQHEQRLSVTGLTQLAQAMMREAHRGPKNYGKDMTISGRFSY